MLQKASKIQSLKQIEYSSELHFSKCSCLLLTGFAFVQGLYFAFSKLLGGVHLGT